MKNKLNIFTNGYLPWYPRNWWLNIRHFFKTIKWGWQRATKGYSDYDTWDLDIYYYELMIASLSQFRTETQGCPAYMNDIEEWYAILDKIIFLLKQASGDEPLEEKNEFTERHKEYYLREEELYQIRKQKRKEAFELMAEYFGHLWW